MCEIISCIESLAQVYVLLEIKFVFSSKFKMNYVNIDLYDKSIQN